MLSNLRQTLDYIEANPQCWNQTFWHCGTSHCFVGTAEMLRLGFEAASKLSYPQPRWLLNQIATMEWLGINEHAFRCLSEPRNTLDDLRHLVGLIEAGQDLPVPYME